MKFHSVREFGYHKICSVDHRSGLYGKVPRKKLWLEKESFLMFMQKYIVHGITYTAKLLKHTVPTVKHGGNILL